MTAIQARLNIPPTGVFDERTHDAVELFQARCALTIDGKVGPITWEALFGDGSAPQSVQAGNGLTATALELACAEIGVTEAPPNSNRGPRVDEYVRAVGLSPSGAYPWCAAFVYYCFDQAARRLSCDNPLIRTAGVRDHWRRAPASARTSASAAIDQPSLVRPGMIFLIGTSGGNGHTGLVEKTLPGRLITIEGNTNDDGSREGYGVFRRCRPLAGINLGFLLYL